MFNAKNEMCVICGSDQMATLLKSSFKNRRGLCPKSDFFSFDLRSSTAGKWREWFLFIFLGHCCFVSFCLGPQALSALLGRSFTFLY